MKHWEVDDLGDEAICASCVSEVYLRAEIEKHGTDRVCRYCNEEGKSFTLDEVAESVERAFDSHYSRTPSEPSGYERAMHNDPESTYDWEPRGESTVYAIMNAANISEAAATDIQSILADKHSDFDAAAMGEETAFADDLHYEEIMPGDEEWQASWRSFEKSIKTEARFFSRTGATQLAELFDHIDEMRTRDGKPLIEEAGPGTQFTHLYRARAFQSDAKLVRALERPDLELAAPPPGVATAGRMNAKGISTFYGATDPEIALAEVRPPVGSQVAISRFAIVRPLKLLNLNALKYVHENGSVFDPQYAYRLGRMMFLRSLSARMARPVMPDDQDSEYLPTQAIADYLATEGKVPLDGILFPSVQAGSVGLNAVLFYKASRCEAMDIPVGTEIEASTARQYEEGWEREYTVIERIPKPEPDQPKTDGPYDPLDFDWVEPPIGDHRETTLRIEADSIKVHAVESVRFKTIEHDVTRYRWAKTEPDF
ncbi:RES domain-containing protein [Mesorhizobium sp. M7A.F.Ca.US.006.04.2.1]|uniref:RES family NAD+ phosphorylase n=1 Tax=unclassified Mesorhizobium TaxID=325217 RepID=UPI000FC9BF0E|nr:MULTISPECIES: RES family NAD+ phosphorylase [unclassified Mesorhizobium]RUX75190.1 RES domain-containing protein [Mesorhizobium sp. M7A.F.Ca.US.005.03.1.1]RUY12281.1 RES domain-containing protein [Mesorhizobium sp. M7A.F.Ca.US.005.03.2.1]RUY28032.1 RES domain-containing protein [Mesorhizobium sp. M7A.F.Ca.US.001.04.2.1]RUY42563.1 RES domain-containing protein [Mesorhizobium sp. M7A.F.Ca.US.001.04.1.1]RVA03015.1 RES domain-containing protein [Mesorhizobium sp. M7A.F.Ca.US.001.02.1.1]